MYHKNRVVSATRSAVIVIKRTFNWRVVILFFSLVLPAYAENIYELRTYVTHEGKLPNLLSRFENHTLKLFEKHGMNNIGYWLPENENNTLIYIISHQSRVAAKQSWKNFVTDPVWKKAFAESKKNGPLVKSLTSVYLTPTEFSLLR